MRMCLEQQKEEPLYFEHFSSKIKWQKSAMREAFVDACAGIQAVRKSYHTPSFMDTVTMKLAMFELPSGSAAIEMISER